MKSQITEEMFGAAIAAIQHETGSQEAALETLKQQIVMEYIEKEQFKPDFLNSLMPEIQKGLSFVHDYKQINSQIIQNINAVIETRYPGSSLDEKLDKATQHEKAIYEASKFLEEKLNVAKFLLHPEWLDQKEECAPFRFHGVVIKYIRIYARRFESKRLKCTVVGESYSEIIANPQAVSVIPHTLIDNAAKYSPQESKVEVYVQDIDNAIEFKVTSYGPQISQKEMPRLFEPFFRGGNAKLVEEEGAGYGLYISQLVAKQHLGTQIYVRQDKQQIAGMGYRTMFSVTLPLRASILLR